MSASSAPSSQRPMTGLFSAAAPIAVRSTGGRKPLGGAAAPNWRKKCRLAWTNSPRATSWRDTATYRSTVSSLPQQDPESFDAQRRRLFGVPVIEEVPNCQRGVGALDPHPVPVALLRRQDDFEVAVGVYLEFVDQFVCGGGDPVHRLQADIPGGAAATG